MAENKLSPFKFVVVQSGTRRCGSVYLGVVVLDILECIYLGNLHARQLSSGFDDREY